MAFKIVPVSIEQALAPLPEERLVQEPHPGQLVRPAGVGDVIAAITKSLHIPQCAGCKKRQALLNKAFPLPCKKCGKG